MDGTMHTANTVDMAGSLDRIVALAGDVERWPEILPHYRWVTLLDCGGDHKTVEMAARRGHFPVRWSAVQEFARGGHSDWFLRRRALVRCAPWGVGRWPNFAVRRRALPEPNRCRGRFRSAGVHDPEAGPPARPLFAVRDGLRTDGAGRRRVEREGD